jgi:hypothetical protein
MALRQGFGDVCLVRAIFDDKLDEKWFLLMKELVGGGWM